MEHQQENTTALGRSIWWSIKREQGRKDLSFKLLNTADLQWTIACEEAFPELKQFLSSLLILTRPIPDTQRNIEANYGAFGDTIVKSMMLHWNQEDTFNVAETFDIIVASDCTFFKDFHRGLARVVKQLLSKAGSSEAIFLSPRRGNSLDLFLEVVEENGLHFSVTENYDTEVWKRHEGFLNGEDRDSWPSYEKDHCYPLLIRITL